MQAALVQTRLQAKPVSAVRASRAPVVTVKAQKVVSMGLMGTKAGMTTFFTANGDALPCTVIALEDGNVVSQVRNRNYGHTLNAQRRALDDFGTHFHSNFACFVVVSA